MATDVGIDLQPPPALRWHRRLRDIDVSMPILLALLAGIFFGIVADTSIENGFTTRLLAKLWDAPIFAIAQAGGQWLVVFLVLLLRQVPGLGPEALAGVTVLTGALLVGGLTRVLLRRGWRPIGVGLFVIALVLNPLVLMAATMGQAPLLTAGVFAAVVLCARRLEEIGDVQAQMSMGLILALFAITDQNAVYFIAAVLFWLPVIYRDITDMRSAVAAYLLVGLPPVIMLSTVFYTQQVLTDEPIGRLLAIWSTPLHGAGEEAVHYEWTARFGGRFLGSLVAMLVAAVILCPMVLAPLLRLPFSRAERAAPGTAFIAVTVPLLAGAAATFFWHTTGVLTFLLCLLTGVAVWMATVRVPRYFRALVIMIMMASLPVAWLTPTPWIEAERRAWRASLTGPVTPREAWNRQVVPRSVLDWGAGLRPRGDVTPAIVSGL